MIGPFGPHDAAFRAVLARIERCRWLVPDAEMEALTSAALSWIDERVDELCAALSRASPSSGEFTAAPVTIERSARAALRRWTTTRDMIEQSPHLGALRAADEDATREIAKRLSVRDVQSATTEVRRAVEATSEPPSPWRAALTLRARTAGERGRTDPPLHGREAHPGAAVADAHACWVLAFGDDASRPSPWAPLLAMFERGTWPMALPDGSVLVYVPVLRDGALVPEPHGTKKAKRFPVRSEGGALFPSLEAAAMKLGVCVPPSLPPLDEGPFGSSRGRVAVVTPLPARR